MKRPHAPALAIGTGVVAGLRPMMALAVTAWALRRGWIRPGRSPFARIVSASASKRLAQLALSELIADKLPFTRSRLNAGPLASRVVSGAICAAAIHRTLKQPVAQGAALGGLGALAGAITGYYVRQRLNREMPDFAAALLEDALAAGGGAVAIALTADRSVECKNESFVHTSNIPMHTFAPARERDSNTTTSINHNRSRLVRRQIANRGIDSE
jgi:uncharacterized membrane protein